MLAINDANVELDYPASTTFENATQSYATNAAIAGQYLELVVDVILQRLEVLSRDSQGDTKVLSSLFAGESRAFKVS